MNVTKATQEHAGGGLQGACLVPGLPHILASGGSAEHARLAKATEELGDRLAARGVERLVYFSTQWISVLGQSFQARERLSGTHVDENWHDVADLSFDFRVDRAFAERLAKAATAAGYQTKLVDYQGFPVDTGTIVADRLLNKGRFAVGMISCWVYSDYADTVKLFGALANEIAADPRRTALVTVSTLSGRYFTTDIDLREDHVSAPADDQWNKRMLGLLEAGQYREAEALVPSYAGACKVDMGFKALAVLRGAGALAEGKGAKVHAYGGIYGTGAAVVEF